MSRLEELKKAYEAATPGEWWEDDDGFVAAGAQDSYETVADGRCVPAPQADANTTFIALAHNLMPQLLEAAVMVRRARNLIAVAVNVHIYDPDNGDVPSPDCPYMAFLNDSKTLLKELK